MSSSTINTRRLLRDLDNLTGVKADKLKDITVFVESEDLLLWRVLLSFSEESSFGLQLAQIGKSCAELSISFPHEYPYSPPSIRLVYPRCLHTSISAIDIGGFLHLQTLTRTTWSPTTSTRSLLLEARELLMSSVIAIDVIQHNSFAIQYNTEEILAAKERRDMFNSSLSPTTLYNFCEKYHCYSIEDTTLELSDSMRTTLKQGNKILLPPSALHTLSSQQDLIFPIMFELCNIRLELLSYCGVLEFTSTEGVCAVPGWLHSTLHLTSGEEVLVRCVQLPKCTGMRVQPHSKEFSLLTDSDMGREWYLPRYSCVSMGDVLQVEHNQHISYLTVLHTQPAKATSLVADPYLDCEIDIAPALEDSLDVTHTNTPSTHTDTRTHTTGTLATDIPTNSVTCSNCHRPIPSTVASMHLATCVRRTTYCENCKMSIERVQWQQHLTEMHTEVKCECGLVLERYTLASHKIEECSLRLVSCPFCSFMVRCVEEDTHVKECGQKTDLCSHCNRYIRRAERAIHDTMSVQVPLTLLYSCMLCTSPTLPESELIQHVLTQHSHTHYQAVCTLCVTSPTEQGQELIHDWNAHMQMHELRLENKRRFQAHKTPGSGWGSTLT